MTSAETSARYRQNHPDRNAAQKKLYKKTHLETVKAQKHRATKWVKRSIVAWDGEGCNLGTGEKVEQLYVLLANSKGNSVVARNGLTTKRCLDFLVDHSSRLDINVIFGGSYDANMMLCDFTRSMLERLWKGETVAAFGFKVRYQHRKCFSVKRLSDGAHMTLWDVLGFFGASFIETLKTWVPEFDITEMAAMKAARPTFDLRDIDAIAAYNADECRLLVTVVTRLFDAFDEADIILSRYDGAGAAAASMMRANKVDTFKKDHPPEVRFAARVAYSGGRIEPCKSGTLDFGTVYRDDINSAYPAIIKDLPCLKCGTWMHNKVQAGIHGNYYGSDFALYHVKFSFPEDQPFYPLFWRDSYGAILYPREGEGWYWKPEVDAMMSWFPENCYTIVESWSYVPGCDHKPFAFVQERFDQRAEMKAQGNMAEVPIKLALNSLYGKMAQQTGWKQGDTPPRYHDLCWAGYVTSATRAKMFTTAMQAPDDIIAFATDAIISTAKLDVDRGKGLGQWTSEIFDGIVLVQAGVYFLREHGKPWASEDSQLAKEAKIRGFDRGTLVRDEIVNAWSRGEDSYPASCTRFVGIGSALSSPSWYHHWRTWLTQDRNLSLLPAGKRSIKPENFWSRGDPFKYANKLVPSAPSLNFFPTWMSKEHSIAWENLVDEATESPNPYEVEKEIIDSYS